MDVFFRFPMQSKSAIELHLAYLSVEGVAMNRKRGHAAVAIMMRTTSVNLNF